MCLKLSNFLRFSRVQSSSGNAAKQGKSPPGDGVQTRTTAAKGTALTSACGNADEGTAASDAARGLDARGLDQISTYRVVSARVRAQKTGHDLSVFTLACPCGSLRGEHYGAARDGVLWARKHHGGTTAGRIGGITANPLSACGVEHGLFLNLCPYPAPPTVRADPNACRAPL